MRRLKFTFADLYCGAGGATTGVVLAAKRRGMKIHSGVAINHNPVSVATHEANHAHILHLCESIERVDPCEAIPGGRLELLWASPECTHHSNARGGRPRQNQSRAGANHVLTWLDKLYVKNGIIENVPEFEDWGPLDSNGQPIKSRKGECFRAFIESLRARNYNVDWRVLCAANYGDATTRERLFVIFRKKPLKIIWPETTHRQADKLIHGDLLQKFKPWKAARAIIDCNDFGTPLSKKPRKLFRLYNCECSHSWSKPGAKHKKPVIHCPRCKSEKFTISEVWLPLSPNTLNRIEIGLKKFAGLSFVLPTRGDNGKRVRSADLPCETLTCESRGRGIITPVFVLGQQSDAAARPVEMPVPTIPCGGGVGLISFLMQTDQTGSNGNCSRHIDQPMPTVVTKQNCALVNAMPVGGKAFMVSTAHGSNSATDAHRVKSLDSPVPTLTRKGEWIVINPFIIKTRGTSKGHISASAQSVDKPVSTLSTSHHHAVVNAKFITSYYGNSSATSVDEPMPTTTTKDRFALVNAKTNERLELEIYYRLFKASELSASHSFPKDYKFAGTKTQVVAQIGNSNPVELTAALTACVLE